MWTGTNVNQLHFKIRFDNANFALDEFKLSHSNR
jgi:hypothetical protein